MKTFPRDKLNSSQKTLLKYRFNALSQSPRFKQMRYKFIYSRIRVFEKRKGEFHFQVAFSLYQYVLLLKTPIIEFL